MKPLCGQFDNLMTPNSEGIMAILVPSKSRDFIYLIESGERVATWKVPIIRK
jgi:hypothetical protein